MDAPTPTPSPVRRPRLAAARRRGGVLTLALAALLLVLSAWLQDDAFVTLRTIDNLLDGRGLRWNPVERVQAFTHPLWLFLNAGAIAMTGDYELTCLLLAMALSLAAVWLVIFRLAPTVRAGVLAALALLLSKSFVDYATSGLEDPLTRLLLALFALAWWRLRPESKRRPAILAGLAALATLSRPDALLLFLPALAAELRRRPTWRAAGAAALGFSPLVLWGLFALFYYGSPWPNTAYAKLGLGVPRPGLVVQGLAYLLDSLLRDPTTLAVIAGVTAIALRRRRHVDIPVLAGGLLYLLYVVWIGGDYMSGRFLGLPLFAAVIAVVRHPLPRLGRRRLAAVLLAAVVLTLPRLLEPLIQAEIGVFGIGDERRVHHPYTGLIYAFGGERWPEHSLRYRGETAHQGPAVRVDGAIGMFGFYAGPDIHVVDVFALSDPLLSRLPGIVRTTFNRPRDFGWRAGHTHRPIPEGYLESLPDGENRLADPDLARYYDVLRRVTRGPLWDAERLRTVVRLNLAACEHLPAAYVARNRALFRPPPEGGGGGAAAFGADRPGR